MHLYLLAKITKCFRQVLQVHALKWSSIQFVVTILHFLGLKVLENVGNITLRYFLVNCECCQVYLKYFELILMYIVAFAAFSQIWHWAHFWVKMFSLKFGWCKENDIQQVWPIPAYDSLYHYIPAFFNLLQPITEQSSLFQPIPAFSSLSQPFPTLPAYSNR